MVHRHMHQNFLNITFPNRIVLMYWMVDHEIGQQDYRISYS